MAATRRFADGAIGFRLEGYDRSLPLVIDPTLVYSSYFGGGAADQINAVQIDSQGLLYTVGLTYTSDLAATDTAYSQANVAIGFSDLFIMILDTTAAGNYSIQYLSYLGGSGTDAPSDMVMDEQGDLFITGTTSSTDFPITGTSIQTTATSTTNNAFVVEFNPSLTGRTPSFTRPTSAGRATPSATASPSTRSAECMLSEPPPRSTFR